MSFVRPRLWQENFAVMRAPAPVEGKEPLPDYQGPRLGPFGPRNAQVSFVKLINVDTLNDDGNTPGNDGFVFEVIIEQIHYALKIFYDHSETFKAVKELEPSLSKEGCLAQFDPFYSECRAYGRIQERHQNGIVAVYAHGFMAIPATTEEFLMSFNLFPDHWKRPEREYSWHVEERQPLRAIVKYLVSNKRNFSNVPQMRDDLFALQGMGVYPLKIEKANYCNGKLVDFSHCWMTPHVYLCEGVRSPKHIMDEKKGVWRDFDEMLEKDGVIIRTKASAGPSGSEALEEGQGDAALLKEDEDDEALLEEGETDAALTEQESSRVTSNTSGKLRNKIQKPDRFGF